ncbi:hypothetical protein CsatA_020853 [Cannabis sativa]
MNCFEILDLEQKFLFVTICWVVWGARNNLVWNGKCFSADNVVAYAKGHLDQWRNAQNSSLESSGSGFQAGDRAERWTIPPVNRIKVNVDATIFEGGRSHVINLVARDDKGLFLEGCSLFNHGVIDPVIAESLGVKEALSWIKEKCWSGMHVETDCLTVAQALRSSIVMLFLFNSIIQDCKNLLCEFSCLMFQFILLNDQ